MKRLTTLLLCSLFLFTLPACGEEGPGKSGESCSNTGAYACFDNIVHLCRFENGSNFWEATEDCGASSTANCQCAIIEGTLGKCSVGGGTSTSANICQGDYL